MTQYDNRNKGALWGNTDPHSERSPHFTGTLDVEGVQYQVSAWKRKPGANPKSPALNFRITPVNAHKDGDGYPSDDGYDDLAADDGYDEMG